MFDNLLNGACLTALVALGAGTIVAASVEIADAFVVSPIAAAPARAEKRVAANTRPTPAKMPVYELPRVVVRGNAVRGPELLAQGDAPAEAIVLPAQAASAGAR